MPKARKTKVKSVKEKQEAGEVLSFHEDGIQHKHEDGTIHSHDCGDVPHIHENTTGEYLPPEDTVVRTVPLSKEEYCEEHGIERLGSNHAQTEYAKYLASLE